MKEETGEGGMNQKMQAGIELFVEGLKEALATPKPEPLLNNAQISKVTGINKNRIAELKKTGKVKTYDQGRRAKASEVEKALEDRPLHSMRDSFKGNGTAGNPYTRRAKAPRTPQINLIDIVGK
jgi:hypothetical protein